MNTDLRIKAQAEAPGMETPAAVTVDVKLTITSANDGYGNRRDPIVGIVESALDRAKHIVTATLTERPR